MEETNSATLRVSARLALLAAFLSGGCAPLDDEFEAASQVQDSEAALLEGDQDAPFRAQETDTERIVIETDARGVRRTLAVGSTHACAIKAQGAVVCWGYNRLGQLGDGTTVDSPVPVPVLGLSGVVELSAGSGGDHTCARKADGTVWCWGLNACGELGNGVSSDCDRFGVSYARFSTVPVQVNSLADAVELAVGQYASCARRRDSSAVCWGFNGYGGLGNGTEVGSGVPVPVVGLTGAVELTMGSGHACARTRDGSASCWGINIDGRLGNGTTDNASTPVPVMRLSRATQLSAGSYHTCARKIDGAVFCWGSAQGAARDGGFRDDALVPTRVPGVRGAGELAAAAVQASCASQYDGSVVCWRGVWAPESGSDALLTIGGVGRVVELGAGGGHFCARRADGTIVCWGYGDRGQLGNGVIRPPGELPLTPVRVLGF